MFFSWFKIAGYLVANNSCEQRHCMPPRNVFAKRNQVKFPIDLHSFAAIGNKQRSIVNITVFFVDCTQ